MSDELLIPANSMFGSYSVVRSLGQGMQGQTLLVEEPQGGRVVIKVFNTSHPQDRRAMEIEVAVLRAAGPECAPRVLEHCLADERPYFVMEYLAGKTIDQILAGKPLGEADTRKLATELAALLEQLHRAGVAHGDFRGQNVMAVQGSYFAIDFGCAKLRTDSLHEFRRGCHADLRHFANLVVRAGTGRAPFGDDVVNAIEKYQSGRPDLGAMSGTLRSVTRTLLTAKPWRLPTARGVHARLRRG